MIGKVLAKVSYDTIELYWLKDQTQTARVVAMLSEPANKTKFGIQDILWGDTLQLLFTDPLKDSRVPDFIVVPKFGVVFEDPGTAGNIMEHGGITHEDTNVPLLISNPGLRPTAIQSLLGLNEVAPTILQALRLNPQALEGVRKERTRVLPGLFPEGSPASLGTK